MTTVGYRRCLWTLSVLLTMSLACTGYCIVRAVLLRVQVSLAEEQTRVFDHCRTHALESSQPHDIVEGIQSAVDYYPSGTKQTSGSDLDLMVERSRQSAIRDMVAHIRTVTGMDLGDDPKAWVERY